MFLKDTSPWDQSLVFSLPFPPPTGLEGLPDRHSALELGGAEWLTVDGYQPRSDLTDKKHQDKMESLKPREAKFYLRPGREVMAR